MINVPSQEEVLVPHGVRYSITLGFAVGAEGPETMRFRFRMEDLCLGVKNGLRTFASELIVGYGEGSS